MTCIARHKFRYLLVAFLAIYVSGCNNQGSLTEGVPKNVPPGAGAPPGVKEMGDDMLKQKAKKARGVP